LLDPKVPAVPGIPLILISNAMLGEQYTRNLKKGLVWVEATCGIPNKTLELALFDPTAKTAKVGSDKALKLDFIVLDVNVNIFFPLRPADV